MKIVAGGLGVDLSLPAAVAAYYRALFLNLTLPGGIVGDVHRGISHGRDAGDVSRALRAVAWERFAGQVVLCAPGPGRSPRAAVACAIVHAVGGGRDRGVPVRVRCTRGSAATPRDGRVRASLIMTTAAGDVRDGLLARRAWLPIALASALFIIAHALLFLIAARTAEVAAPASRMLPLALLVMLVMVVPSVAGWGPREGVTAWASAWPGSARSRGSRRRRLRGAGAVASLPGAVVLLADVAPAAPPRGRATSPTAAGSPPPAGTCGGRGAVRSPPLHAVAVRHVDRRLLDGARRKRLLLSNDVDFDRVDQVRAAVDAILVGATTMRKDDPRLLVRRGNGGPRGGAGASRQTRPR